MDELTMFEQILKDAQVPERYYNNKDREYKYWFRALFQRLDASIKFKGIPEEWPENVFKMLLYAWGYMAVFHTEHLGTTFATGHLSGFDFYYNPRRIFISNPNYIENGKGYTKQLDIGTDCEIIKLCGDYRGVLEIVDYYAQKLASLSIALNMNAANAKIPAVFGARNEAEKRTIEAAYDDVQSGKPIIITKNPANSDEVMPVKDILGIWNQDFKQTYIVTQLLADINTLLDNFDAEIGIARTVDKNSHILNEEAGFQADQANGRIRDWLGYLAESFKLVNKKFNLRLEANYACEDDDSRDREIPEQTGKSKIFGR